MTHWPAEITLRSDPVSAVQLALFAAASGDHNPLHLDPDVARRAGFERPVVHGMLTMALAGRLFTQRFGAGRVQRLQTRFAGIALVGEVIEISATLEECDDSGASYRLRGGTSTGRDVVTGYARVTA